MIGPPVPQDIQRARDLRLGRNINVKSEERYELTASPVRNAVLDEVQGQFEPEDSSSEDEFGPALPSNAGNNDEEEKQALERLAHGYVEQVPAKQPAESAERSNWMDFALSGSTPSSKPAAHNSSIKPKLFQRDAPVLSKNPSTERHNGRGTVANARQSLSNRFSKAQ